MAKKRSKKIQEMIVREEEKDAELKRALGSEEEFLKREKKKAEKKSSKRGAKSLENEARGSKSDLRGSKSDLRGSRLGVKNAKKTKKSREKMPFKVRWKKFWQKRREKYRKIHGERVNPHKSFKRSYREDYVVETNVPGVMYHIFATFKILLKNWKVFLPLLVLVVILSAVFVGIMDQGDYAEFQEVLDETTEELTGTADIGVVAKAGMLLISTITTGGLSGDSSEAAIVFGIIIFIITWLVTIFLLRHILAGNKVKLRDGLYNAMTPMITTLIVVAVAIVQCIPIFALIIVYSAAVQTEFLSTPFYALVFFIFAAVMILLSGYFLSSSLIALVAVSAPGLYPLQALHTASDLMMGRRTKFIIRLIAGFLALVILWVIIMLPMILIDLGFKNFEWAAEIPFVPICLATMTWFTAIYATAYVYLYYRWMLKTA